MGRLVWHVYLSQQAGRSDVMCLIILVAVGTWLAITELGPWLCGEDHEVHDNVDNDIDVEE
jgi:hypothetical protein